jgi:signal transduction histidine kinase
LVYWVFQRQKLKLKRELEVQQKLESERIRISRDLHDNVGAQLSFLISNVEWMLAHPEAANEVEENSRLKALSETGRNAILTLRQTIWAISHTELSMDDFADRFKQFALKMIEFDQGIQLHFSEQFERKGNLSPANALNMFRICQEIFNNCLKHSQCKNIHIRFLSNSDFSFQCEIKDDGIGFNWETAKQKGHYGLVNIEARALETGAILKVDSKIGSGTRIEIGLK